MRYFVCFILLFCGACSRAKVESPDQKVVRSAIETEHKGDPVQWLQWWPAVDAKDAGLSDFLDEQQKRWKSEVRNDAMDAELVKKRSGPRFHEGRIRKVEPNKMIRVRYRVADSKGNQELHDEVHFLSGQSDEYRRPFKMPDEISEDFPAFAGKLFPN